MKKLLPIVSLASSLVFAECQVASSSCESNGPHGLTAEYRENPCGIDAAVPRLGWKMGQGLASNAKGVTQVAYRVLVSSSFEKQIGRAHV